MLALFRLVEAEGGSVEIDGINIATLGLDTLRSRLSIIPQVLRIIALYACLLQVWPGTATSHPICAGPNSLHWNHKK